MPFNTLLCMRDTVLLLETIQASLSCTSEQEFKALIQRTGALIPFDFAIATLASLDPRGGVERIRPINISYPHEWLDLYVTMNFLHIDPIVKENLEHYQVQYWAETYRKHEHPREFIGLAESFGLKNGYSFGVGSGSDRKGSLFSLAGDVEQAPRHSLILETLAPHLHQSICRVLKDAPPPAACLSPRETEVLNWVKTGKNSWEISMILKISERTVKYHIGGIMKKLDAASRSHAVAIAMCNGMLPLD